MHSSCCLVTSWLRLAHGNVVVSAPGHLYVWANLCFPLSVSESSRLLVMCSGWIALFLFLSRTLSNYSIHQISSYSIPCGVSFLFLSYWDIPLFCTFPSPGHSLCYHFSLWYSAPFVSPLTWYLYYSAVCVFVVIVYILNNLLSLLSMFTCLSLFRFSYSYYFLLFNILYFILIEMLKGNMSLS